MMGGGDHTNKGDQTSKKPSSKQSSASPKDQQLTAVVGPHLAGATTSNSSSTPSPIFEQVPVELSVNPKRPRFGAASTTTSPPQWKLLPSPSSQPRKKVQVGTGDESSPSPVQAHHHVATATAASSSETTSSPPVQSPEGEKNPPLHLAQFRKGKYVSPVWKPYEMLWLARAWRVQYQGQGTSSEATLAETRHHIPGLGEVQLVQPAKGKTRADKDREVAEFLNRHGVSRDAKTAGTKWDNMLGEFRKVYEWERGGEREQIGKSYFRLSPYERKMHRLPASFDEEVFEELAQFMGSRVRNPQVSKGGEGGDDGRSPGGVSGLVRALPLPPPPPFTKDDDPLLSYTAGRGKQLATGTQLGFEAPAGEAMTGIVPVVASSSSSLSSKQLRRIGKMRMTWEEWVSLWADEGEQHQGRVKLQSVSSSFLNADELAFFDDSMVACTMEAFEAGPLKGFSVDKFVSGQQVKVFGRRRRPYSSSPPPPSATTLVGPTERIQLPLTESSLRTLPPSEYQDPTEYYVGCLRVPQTTLPTLIELSWYLQDPPPEELRFPLRKDVYRDLPPGKELFFTSSTDLLDCRSITFDILSSIIRTNPSISSSTASSRDSYIGLWDDCVNRIVSKFCSVELVMIRKPSGTSLTDSPQDQWPNLTGFVRNFCLWRGEEIDQVREGQRDPASSLVEKLLWTYSDLPYILGYFAIGYLVTFCALSRSQDNNRIVRTDLYTLDLSSPLERIKALVPCYRVASLLPLLADRCLGLNVSRLNKHHFLTFSDFERVDLGNGNVMEVTPNTVTKLFSSKRRWAAVKEIHELFDHRIPHAEFICSSSEKDLALVFKPRGIKVRPANCEQLMEALKCVTKALVALHDLGFMHRDLSWDKVVLRRTDPLSASEWVVCGFDEAAGAPQLYPHATGEARGHCAPEMGRVGVHGVKVDVWGVGHLIKTSGLGPSLMPKMLGELQNRCLDPNPEQRPTAADCYHHLLQVQSSLQAAATPSGHVY